ncbi:hypothetical protein ACEPAI_2053 [Sanghuangporus weigelae]
MPGTSRTQQKAEARYNVTTQFPQYDLHFAAASGNLGLVEFALSHGQPINSVLNGVLPLHAACAGGSEVVVKYLIDEGADVNAPRIPRRYSNEKHKSSGLAVGASGSTPLHFAAANGHLGVVKLLLAHGAVPDRADKHGVTPEMLARNTGWVECADVLAAWSGGRAGDLPPVQPGGKEEASSGPGSVSGSNCPMGSRGNESTNDVGNTGATVSSTGEKEKDKDGCEISELIQSGSRRLHMKRSIDNALHLFKTPLLHHHGSHGQLRDRERERDKSPPSPSAAAHPQSQSQSQPQQPSHNHSHSIFPLHHHHQHSHSHSHGGSPPSHSHLHSLFHHGHSHSTSQLQTQASTQSQPQSQSQSQSTSQSTSTTDNAFRPSLSTGASVTSSSSLHPNSNSNSIGNPFDGPGVPGNRRPSLPHIFNEPASPFQRRLSGRKRRPRSAGSDAGQEGSANAGNGNENANPSGNANGVSGSGSRLAAVGMMPNAYSSGYPTNLSNTNVNVNAGTGTGTTRKLSSKISLRNLFRRAGGEASISSNTNSNAYVNANTNSSLNLSGSEPGSGSASASTSFSNSAPIYNHAFSASVGARGTASPPASPLSASFAPSPSPMGGGGGRPGSWYRQRIGSEGAGSVPVPRSPLVPSAVELHHRYSQERLHEEFEDEAPAADTVDLGGVAPGSAPAGPGVVAPRLSARPSILRGQGQSGSHNRSVSSQSSSGTGTPGGTRTLRFDATASPAEATSMSPEPRWGSPVGASVGTDVNTSAIGLRGMRSASSLRHEHSYGYNEDEEDEEEDYGTSINPSESTALRFDDAELEESTAMLEEGERDVDPSTEAANYAQYVSAGRARGASFASTASSSSPGVSPENRNADYERNEFPFSIDGPPPLTPVSVTSSASVTTHYNRPDDALLEGDNKDPTSETKKRAAESRARGESFSSVETDRSEPSQTGTSSTSNLTTPSPGTDLRMTNILGGDDNDTEVPTNSMRDDSLPTTDAKETSNGVYLHASPSSSLDELGLSNTNGQESAEELQTTKNSHSPTTPTALPPELDLRGISNLAEAEALVRRAQQAILASASLPADGPESPDVPLSAQLAAYGEILALERRFARGEKQRELWAVRDDSDGEAEGGGGGSEQHNASANESGEVKTPKSAREAAKEARMALTQKKRDVAVLRQRGATTDAAVGLALGPGASSLRQRAAPARPAKQKRPHTAEGAPQASWGFSSPSASTSASPMAADATIHSAGTSPTSHAYSHSRSTSTPLYISSKESEKLPDIAIIETTATPIDSPEATPDSVAPRISPSPSVAAAPPADHDYPYTRYTIDDARASLPLRSRTPDPDPSASTDDFGVPLTRVATAPLQDSSAGYGSGSGSYNARGSSSVLRSDPTTRRTGAAHKLSKMGFSVDAASHHHHASRSNSGHGHHYRSHRQKEIQDAYSISPASSAGSSRSPSKARFGGIKSLVRGLKGKS